MKTVVINRGSWHYKLAEHVGFSEYRKDEQNLCTYVIFVMCGCLIVGLVTSIIVFANIIVADFLAWIVSCFMNGFSPPWPFALSVIVLMALAVTLVFIRGLFFVSEKIEGEFVSHAYTSLRDKICYRLEVK